MNDGAIEKKPRHYRQKLTNLQKQIMTKSPTLLQELIEQFKRNIVVYKQSYNETMLRREFIDPFFEVLGWDVTNKAGYAEAYKDVIHEDSIKIGGSTKAPDYGFRIGGTRKFFVETKRPAIDIKEDIHPAYQLRRYAWSAKLPLSILTDFEEFAVYDCRIKPVKTDKASTARIIYLTYEDYLERWDEIASVFSKEEVLKGSFDRYVETAKRKKGTAEVDNVFLKEIEAWRAELVRNIALRNIELSQRDLNFAVARTIDRIIFLRIAEDRGMEDYGQLMALQNGSQVYQRLKNIFHRADEKYNSGLFHFHREKNRTEPPDELSLKLLIDDKILKDIFKRLYYPDSPYEFSVLPADILGHIYEQFLGKVIRLTPGHRAVVEDKPEVRKAGGVYYTPTYIVDYIVKNTVGKLLEKKTPRQVSKLKILDPACGSGSFLIGAYQYLLDWHRDWYAANDPAKWAKAKTPVIYQKRNNDWRLTTAKRKEILLNNIYGVDIDNQAVEVTKLSLLLKVLEGESGETINRQRKLFHERALPDLGNNIKCGNSLIGPDFYDDEQISLLDEEQQYRINAFDWEVEFPEVFGNLQDSATLKVANRGPGRRSESVDGFDAVIGNPPYVRQETLGNFKEYFKQHYNVYHGIGDLYAYFIERGFSLLKTGGQFCYIVANKWMRANYGRPLRSWMKNKRIEEIIDFGDLPVFKGATTYPCILRISLQSPRTEFLSVKVKTLSFPSLKDYVVENSYPVNQTVLMDSGWSLVDEKTRTLFEKLIEAGIPLGEFVRGKIYYGIKTGLNRAFVINEETRQRLIREDPCSKDIIKPFLAGKDVKRYNPLNPDKHLILIPKGWTNQQSDFSNQPWYWLIENYPAIAAHLALFEREGKKRFDKGDYWWELRTCEYYDEFEKLKMVFPDISLRGNFALDETGRFYCANTTYIIPSGNKYLLGILNSMLVSFIYKGLSSTYRGGYLRFIYQYLIKLPIHPINLSDPTDKSRHDKMVKLVDKMLGLHKRLNKTKTPHDREVLQRQINATDRQIDKLVYELYDLTEVEIGIVEGSL